MIFRCPLEFPCSLECLFYFLNTMLETGVSFLQVILHHFFLEPTFFRFLERSDCGCTGQVAKNDFDVYAKPHPPVFVFLNVERCTKSK